MNQYEFHTQPFKHQLQAFEQTRELPSYGILWEQGCGKTKLAIDNACYLYEQDKINAVLVIAPNGVHRNWLTDELPAHVPTRLRRSCRAEVWDSVKSKQVGHKRKMEELLKHSGLAWLFMSYDGFMTERGKAFAKRFLLQRRCFYALDEAHNIKSPNAKRTKTIVASGKYAPYRRILTGTPVANGPFDLYSQVRFLDEDFWKRHELANFQAFKFHYGEWLTRTEAQNRLGFDPGYDKLIRYKNLEELNSRLASISTRVTKETAGLNLPPKLFSKRYYELTSKQRDFYQQLREKYIIELENGSIVDGTLPIVRLLRLQQIACGYMQTDTDEPVKLIEEKNPRLNALEDIISGIYSQGIVWARFTKDIDQIMELLGSNAVRYDGKVSDDEAEKAKQQFQRGEVQWFVGNPAKGKEGLTFVNAKHVIYYSNSFKLIDRLQSEDRAHRIGQEDKVSYIDIEALNTVDSRIINALRDKYDIAAQITGDQLKEWI